MKWMKKTLAGDTELQYGSGNPTFKKFSEFRNFIPKIPIIWYWSIYAFTFSPHSNNMNWYSFICKEISGPVS